MMQPKSKWMVLAGLALVLIMPTLSPRAFGAASADLERGFVSPPDSARPWVYWFWLNSNITRAGITADLEAMKRAGIGGVLIMEVDQGAPVGPVAFMSEQWRDLFKFMVAEADRLGLEVNMNNDAGWNGSGGPWVPLDKAMQAVTISELPVAGGQRFEGVLPQPRTIEGYYRDIAVLAFPTPATDRTLAEAGGVLTTSAGQTVTNTATVVLSAAEAGHAPYLQVTFPEPYTAGVLEFTARGLSGTGTAALQVSSEGTQFQTVKEFKIENRKVTVGFDAQTSRYYRLQLLKADAAAEPISLANFDLSGRYRLADRTGAAAAFTWGGALLAQNRPGVPATAVVPPNSAIIRLRVKDLTTSMDQDGRLTWDAPAGQWTVLRLGHTFTGAKNHPAPASGSGPECDKLSPEGIETQFNGMMGKLIADVGPLAGKTLMATHVDSWEVGAQLWTPRMREEFRKRRGYDLLRFLPALTGRVVDNRTVSERFLWDLRQTVSDLLAENYIGHLQKLAHQHGLKLSMESYTTPANDLDVANYIDEPISEFWWPGGGGLYWSVKAMSSAAHLNQLPIVGAEAFTADGAERWRAHPALLKNLGDRAFCDGVNRFIFHRYAMQPWLNYRPGMTMGPWGQHYERTQTWWEQSAAWHRYLARCQYLLRQGLFVADVLDLQPEDASARFRPRTIAGYDYDACSPQAFLAKVTVQDGRLTVPGGMSYRLLVLPDTKTMTLPMLGKIAELVNAGAAILGAPPSATPGMADFPMGDMSLRQLVPALWGPAMGLGPDADTNAKGRRVGKGIIFQGIKPEEALAQLAVAPDFTSDTALRWIHRRVADTDLYFVAHPGPLAREVACTFRVAGKRPELWRPDTGVMTSAARYAQEPDGRITVPIRFDPNGSVFVVFRSPIGPPAERAVALTRNGQALWPSPLAKGNLVIQKAVYGVLTDPQRTRDVQAKVQALVDGGESSFPVGRLAQDDDPAFGVVKTLVVEYRSGGQALKATGQDPETITLPTPASTENAADLCRNSEGRLQIDVCQNGRYELQTADGQSHRFAVAALPEPREIEGPWDLQFPPNAGAPAQVTLPKLISWTDHPEPGVKYFSGTATYRRTLSLPADLFGPNRRWYLDLGQVQVMAQVKLNGRDLGLGWKPPYRVEITEAAQAGTNTLEISVVNLWPNRMIGDEQLPEDSARNANGTLRAWPPWVLDGKPSPAGRFTFTSWKLWKKNEPLLESGLLGPVRLQAAERITIPRP